MIREEGLDAIWDGRYYDGDDLVRCGSAGCSGCSACCRFTDDTILLDPLDCLRLTKATGKTFLQLLEERLISLKMVDDLVLPHIQMICDQVWDEEEINLLDPKEAAGAIKEKKGSDEEHCPWLSKEGRCLIHEERPDLCRLFPLARVWMEDGSFRYILQKDACIHPGKTKVKVDQWLGLADAEQIRLDKEYRTTWHTLLVRLREKMQTLETEQQRTALSVYLLRNFYERSWLVDETKFCRQFAIRAKQALEGL